MVNGKTKLIRTFGICIFAQEIITELLHLFCCLKMTLNKLILKPQTYTPIHKPHSKRSTPLDPHYAVGRVPSTIGTTASKSTTTYSSTMIHAQMMPFSNNGGGGGGTIKSHSSSQLMLPQTPTTQKSTANKTTTNPLAQGNQYITHTRR